MKSPIDTEIATVLTPTRREMRLAKIVRLKISRPSLSVPSGCSAANTCKSFPRFWWFGLCGASAGAKIAVATSSASREHPKYIQRLFFIADAWIDEAVENVGNEIDEKIAGRNDQHTALHQRVVSRLDRL